MQPLDAKPALGARAGWLAAGVVGLALLLQLAAVFRAGVHWDEFAVFHLADLTETSGSLRAGGRAGLAVVMLLPFVRDCDDEIAVVRRARLLWLGLTAAWLAGVALWIAQLAPPGERGRDAALGVALLALVPAFLDASLQVRTDHLALLGGSWGGAALLASRRRPALAGLAGAAFGAGLLGSQKVIYVAALAGLLAAGQLWLARELRPRRELARAAGVAAGLAAALLFFRLAVGLAFQVPEVSRVRTPIDRSYVEHGFSLFDYYRNTIGWSQYRALAPQLVPHALLLLALGAATWRAGRDARPRLALAWAVLALGLAVALFHAAAFAYFWLTLGLFPALAFGLARGPLEALVPSHRRRAVAAGLLALLLLPALVHQSRRLADSQAVQRESLGFVHRNFDRGVTGFQPESGLFCQAGAQPFPTFFSQHLYQRFAGPERQRHTDWLLQTFREAPVEFLVQSFRLNQFPAELRRFWSENYQPYRASVFVAGRRLQGARGERAEFELVVPGAYRWIPVGGPHPLEIGDRVVAAGEVVELASGPHTARFVEDVPAGLLVLALAEPPGEAPLPFYQ